MNNGILKRLERLEKAVPSDLIVEYAKGDDAVRSTMKEFCQECRADGKMYTFKVVDGSRMEDIDMLIALIDDEVKNIL